MENKENPTGYYNNLIWLILDSYDTNTKVYSPIDYILEEIKIDNYKGIIQSVDSSIYDFTTVKGAYKYIEMIQEVSEKFNNALAIIPYISSKYIIRDCYLANLAKIYTCWDTVYINCEQDINLRSNSFDFIVTKEELPEGLTEIIGRAYE